MGTWSFRLGQSGQTFLSLRKSYMAENQFIWTWLLSPSTLCLDFGLAWPGLASAPDLDSEHWKSGQCVGISLIIILMVLLCCLFI